jgi:hypothetical protein
VVHNLHSGNFPTLPLKMVFSKTRLVALNPDKTNCSIMVRVLRVWDVESMLMPGRVSSSELLLMDIEVRVLPIVVCLFIGWLSFVS